MTRLQRLVLVTAGGATVLGGEARIPANEAPARRGGPSVNPFAPEPLRSEIAAVRTFGFAGLIAVALLASACRWIIGHDCLRASAA